MKSKPKLWIPANAPERNPKSLYNPDRVYVPLQIELLNVCGVYESLLAMRLPKRSKGDSRIGTVGSKDAKLAKSLILAGNDHAKATRGIIAYLRLELQVGWMIEFETYRHGVECLSTSSSMHNELKTLSGPELAERKQSDLPDKIYTRIVTISYQALRNMYVARRNHRHSDWQIFCDFVETLPHFSKLIVPERGV